MRVRDFGSLNGTHVNGEEIGRRLAGQTPEEGALLDLLERDLGDGDQIELGNTILEVGVAIPVHCAGCGVEIPDAGGSGALRCAACLARPADQQHEVAVRCCTVCEREIPADVAGRQGEVVCASCQRDANAVALDLLQKAADGDADLAALRGYRLVTELARGERSVVYLACRDDPADEVALKVLLPEVAVDQRAKDSFLRDIDATKTLTHPNVVAVRDCGVSGATFYLTSQYCTGGSLADLMGTRGAPFDPDEAVSMMVQVLAGLAYAHAVTLPPAAGTPGGPAGAGRVLVHRHITPHNILLPVAGSTGVAKLADFGLARAFDAAGLSGQSMSGHGVQSVVEFMSRPQLIHYAFAKPEVDVWACAATLYWMLTRSPPRDFPRGQDPVMAVLHGDPVSIRDRNITIPSRLAAVIDAALIDEPRIEITTATELSTALQDAL
jgi:serine/threonine protein kinase